MNKQKGLVLSILISIIALIIFAGGIYFYIIPTAKKNTSSQKLISISLYVQDKEAARLSDCRITQKITYQVPMTSNIPDTSLRMLFKDELSRYGIYDSVSVTDGVAKVMLKSDMDPRGKPLQALSSCESGHLLSVLNDTLTQYDTIKSVELHSPNGRIEF